MPDLVHERRFRVHTYEAGPTGEARPTVLLHYLQEAADEQAAAWGIALSDLLPRGRAWVVSRYRLRVTRYPRFRDELVVRTWPSAREGLFAVREYEVTTPDGAPLAVATTSWMLLDTATGRPVPVAQVVPEGFVRPRRALDDPFASLPRLETATRELRFRVMVRDLDLNRHVNNAIYVQWALEAVPPELLRRLRPADVEISYRAMAYHGEEIVSRLQPVDGAGDGAATFVHEVANAADGRELARVRSRWEDLPCR